MRPEECDGCPLVYNPLLGYFTSLKVDVVFIGHAPTRDAVTHGVPFYGFSLLWSSIREVGLESYGITNAWKCVLEKGKKQINDPNRSLHSYCLKWLLEELTVHQPQVSVPLGNGALGVMTHMPNHPYNVFKRPGETGYAERLGDFRIMPMMHPEMAGRDSGQWLGMWYEGFDKLGEFFEGDFELLRKV